MNWFFVQSRLTRKFSLKASSALMLLAFVYSNPAQAVIVDVNGISPLYNPVGVGIDGGNAAASNTFSESSSQNVAGGKGGDGISGGGNGGNADSVLNISGNVANPLNVQSVATGGQGGYGVLGGSGGNGGAASSTLTIVDTAANSVAATSTASGGAGGNTGGNGGNSVASADVTSAASSMSVTVNANGGNAQGNGTTGGTASATARGVSTSGGDVSVNAFQQGGQSVSGGVSTVMNNAVSGFTTGVLRLNQFAAGGAGVTSSDDAFGGNGGNATSILNLADNAASQLTVSSTAYGGGATFPGAHGGDANSQLAVISGAASVLEGNSLALSGGAGSHANALSDVTSVMMGANVQSYADARSDYGYFHDYGIATSFAKSRSLGADATANSYASSSGTDGLARAQSNNSDGGGNSVTVYAEAPTNTNGQAAITMAGGGGYFNYPGNIGVGSARAGGSLVTSSVSSLNGVSGDFHVIGSGGLGANSHGDATNTNHSYTTSASYSFSLLDGNQEMYLGFSNAEMTGSGFDNATLRITKNGTDILNQNFLSFAGLLSIINSGLMDLGSATGQVSLSISLVQVLSGIGNGVGISYQVALASVPLPSALLLFATALLMLMFAAQRRKALVKA